MNFGKLKDNSFVRYLNPIRVKNPDRVQMENNTFVLYISVILLVLFRLLLTATIPLLDKTEARYAEIARIMWETKQWIVPQIDYGVPFMAKPPLSTWLSAVSFGIFGVNEFASRFPSFILNILIIIIAGKVVKKQGLSFYLPGFILLTMPEFLIHTGVVSTDTVFAFCTSLAMIAFWKTINNQNEKFWNYVFFVALGFGMLAKGPIVFILTVPPIIGWCFLDKNRFRELLSKFTWVAGIIITLLIAIPWYYFVEQKSPGFLNYFIVGEHFKRFFEPGWKGDLYGFPKSQPIGMVWVFMIAFSFPWIQIVLYKLWKNRKTVLANSWLSFLVLWLFWTPVFFTFSRNIIHTYTLPMALPIMFLMVYYWDDFQSKKAIIRTALLVPVLIFIAYFVVSLTGKADHYLNSDKYILEHLKATTETKGIPIYYYKRKNYSGQFYLNGQAQVAKRDQDLDSILKLHKKIFFVIWERSEQDISKEHWDRFILLEKSYKTSIFVSK
jgi:4-amino-4-deoxy-L-arabinose transferase-like glycosyltransferase